MARKDRPLEAEGLGTLVSAQEAAAILGRPEGGIHTVLRAIGVRPVHLEGVLILRRGRRAFYRKADVEAVAARLLSVSDCETGQGKAQGGGGDP